MKKIPNSSALAMIFHLTHAESARPRSDSSTIHNQAPANIPHARYRLFIPQPVVSKPASMDHSTKPGTHVMSDSGMKSTAILPMTYSAFEIGRQRYRGNALLLRSGATRPGAAYAVKRNESNPWM